MTELQDNISELEDTRSPGDGDHVDRVLGAMGAGSPRLDTSPVAVVARLGRAAAYSAPGSTRASRNSDSRERAGTCWPACARTGPPHRLSPTELYVGPDAQLRRDDPPPRHLERHGLITRVPDPDDARGMLVELTRKGNVARGPHRSPAPRQRTRPARAPQRRRAANPGPTLAQTTPRLRAPAAYPAPKRHWRTTQARTAALNDRTSGILRRPAGAGASPRGVHASRDGWPPRRRAGAESRAERVPWR